MPTARDDPTDGERRGRIEALVAACIEAIEAGEADPTSRVCAETPDLTTAVRRRLAELGARGLIAFDADAVPTEIGPYRVLSELGSGGMGAVYLAEQREPVQREVALKVVKLGMDTRQVVARFAAERQALALMSHPHVAQVYDAGITPEGRPYFVMEYVRGVAITTFCDERRLAMEARLRLLATVCRAVQHAHDKGVIHRDLKPSNVLVLEVDGELLPKVIDFGIAKVTGQAMAEWSMHTRSDQVLGTPEYMSPEQACSGGLDVDTRTDVYSLGVMLYELLCGELPYDSRRLRAAGRREMERILMEEPTPVPSARLGAAPPAVSATRGTDGTALRRRVKGDLDWIVLKALSKERKERYPSPLALAEDLERHLRHEPVVAVPPDLWYRARKLLRRHALEFGAAAAVLAALVTGPVVSVRFWLRERDAAAAAIRSNDETRDFYGLARKAVESMLVLVGGDRLRHVPHAEPVRRELLEDALRFYETLAARRPADPALQVEIVYARDRMGTIYSQLGQLPAAEKTFGEGIARLDEMIAVHPKQEGCWRLRAVMRSNRAIVFSRLGRREDAKKEFRAALADLEALAALTGGEDGDAAVEGGIWNNLAIASDADPQKERDCLTRAMSCLERAAAHAPEDRELQVRAAMCKSQLGEVMLRAGEVSEAETLMRGAVERLERFVVEHPDFEARDSLARAHGNVVTLLRRLGRLDEAERAQEVVNALLRHVSSDHPKTPVHADDVAGGIHELADIVEERGDLERALGLYREAVAAHERAAKTFPQLPHLRMRVARAWQSLGRALVSAAQHQRATLEEAMAACRSAVATADALHEELPEDEEVALTLAGCQAGLATLLDQHGDAEAALAAFGSARGLLEDLVRASPKHVTIRLHLAGALNNLAWALMRRERWAEAVADATAGVEHALAGLEVEPRHPGLCDLLPRLAARLGHARKETGDEAGVMKAALFLVETAGVDDRCREKGAVLLGQQAVDVEAATDREAWLERAATALRDALARLPAVEDGGEPAIVVRIADLRCTLAEVLRALGQDGDAAACLASAAAVVQACPSAPADCVRCVYLQLGQTLLRRGDAAAAAARAEELAARLRDDGEGNYIAARLLAMAAKISGDGVAVWSARAVECLKAALTKEFEPPKSPARDPDFAALHAREDFRAVMQGRRR